MGERKDTSTTPMADLIRRSSLGRPDVVRLASLTSQDLVAQVLSAAAAPTNQAPQTATQPAKVTLTSQGLQQVTQSHEAAPRALERADTEGRRAPAGSRVAASVRAPRLETAGVATRAHTGGDRSDHGRLAAVEPGGLAEESASDTWVRRLELRFARDQHSREVFLAPAVTKNWMQFLTALLVLITAALGLYTKQLADQRDEAEAGSSELAAERADLEQQIAELEEQKAALEADLEEAQQPPDTGGTTAMTLDSTSEVRRESGDVPVTIALGSGIDLDTAAPNWGVDASGTDVFVHEAPYISGAEFVLVREPPAPANCAASTLLVDTVTAAETVVGQQFCVHTDEGRWAYVRIAAIDTEASTMSFDIIVWKLPTDP